MDKINKGRPTRINLGIKNEFTNENIFYHGTTSDFTKFKNTKKAALDKEVTEQPIFLAEDKDFAENYRTSKDAKVLPVSVKKGNYLDFRKDLFLNKPEYGSYDKLYNSLSDVGKKIYDAIDNGEINLSNTRFSDYDAYDVFSKKLSTGDYDFIEIKPFKEWLIKNGFDGVYLKEHPSEKSSNLAVFNIDKLQILNSKSISEAYHKA